MHQARVKGSSEEVWTFGASHKPPQKPYGALKSLYKNIPRRKIKEARDA